MTRPHRLLALLAAVVVAGACVGGGSSGASRAPASAPAASATPSSPGASTSADACPTSQPPALAAGEKRVVTIETAKGKIQVTVEADLGPQAAGNFVALVSCGFYDGLVFHRVVPGFVIQGGDPEGTGRGGPGYKWDDEPVLGEYTLGALAMANAGPNTNGSQFFITTADCTRNLGKSYNLFGYVVQGMDVALATQRGDVMRSVSVEALEREAGDA